jgi:DNA helicase-2/ATP-dependent DNA helicase PcrA
MPAPSRFLRDIDEKYIEMPKVFNPQTILSHNNFSMENEDFIFENSNKKTTDNFQKPTSALSGFKPVNAVVKSTSTVVCDFNVGEKVKHFQFGTGTILDIEGNDGNTKIKIDFDNGGIRFLLLRYARLEKIIEPV